MMRMMLIGGITLLIQDGQDDADDYEYEDCVEHHAYDENDAYRGRNSAYPDPSSRRGAEDNTSTIPRASADPGPSSRRYTAAPVITEVEERAVETATERSFYKERERQDNMT